MSNLSVRGEQSTSSEITALVNLTLLGTSGAGQFIRKTGAGTFENATPAGGAITIQTVSGTINGSNTAFTVPTSFSGKSWMVLNTTFLIEDVHYTVSGTNITYLSAPPAGLSGKPHKLFCLI